MADVKLLAPIIFQWEGGLADNKIDRGGKTNMGVTLDTWKSCGYDKDGDNDIDENDLKLITKDDATNLLKKYYWKRCQADLIKSQGIANILVDWVWASGKWGIIKTQELLGLVADGLVGAKTNNAINSQNEIELFEKIKQARIDFVENLVKNHPEQSIFKKGWINRINSFKIV